MGPLEGADRHKRTGTEVARWTAISWVLCFLNRWGLSRGEWYLPLIPASIWLCQCERIDNLCQMGADSRPMRGFPSAGLKVSLVAGVVAVLLSRLLPHPPSWFQSLFWLALPVAVGARIAFRGWGDKPLILLIR